jgi:salicylate hydroxylase
MAVEDALALSRTLSKVTQPTDLPTALHIFEKVRINRASKMQEASLLNGKLWHFPDGPVQRARDAAMKAEVLGMPFSHSPNQWSDPATQMWAYGYDAEGEVERVWGEVGSWEGEVRSQL